MELGVKKGKISKLPGKARRPPFYRLRGLRSAERESAAATCSSWSKGHEARRVGVHVRVSDARWLGSDTEPVARRMAIGRDVGRIRKQHTATTHTRMTHDVGHVAISGDGDVANARFLGNCTQTF